MAKAKKNVKLGVNVMENLINSGQFGKVESMIKQGKFTAEAVRYALDKRGEHLVWEAKRVYPFNELYSSFEDYINSKVAKDLYENGDSSHMFDWMSYYPSNSEELMAIYNKQDTAYMKSLVFKNVIYRERVLRMNLDIRDSFLNCFDGILEMIKLEYNPANLDALTYMIVWSQYVSKDWGYKIEKIIGLEETVKLFMRRLEMRREYFANLRGLSDLKEIHSFLQEVAPDRINIDYLIKALSAFDWDYGLAKEDISSYIEKAQPLYDTYVHPQAVKSLKDIYKAVTGDIAKIHATIHTFEKEEKILDLTFSYAIKRSGSMSAVCEILYLQKKGIPVRITPFMEQLSETMAKDWSYLLLTKEITSGAELMEFKDKVFPFDHKITPFTGNPNIIKNIALERFSNQDIEMISAYLDWSRINHYFFDEVAPFEFIMAHREKISEYFSFSHKSLSKYTAKQLSTLVETFESKIDPQAISQIVSHCCSYKEGLSEEDAVNLLRRTDFIDINGYGGTKKNSKLDLQSILTLI